MVTRESPQVVVIGGGTGTFVVLSGLKKYPLNLTAVVSMADSGGSSGLLRSELGILPPGSVRPALIALSESPELLRNLFTHRFRQGQLKGHVLGNLLLAGLNEITGSFTAALREAGQILRIRGRVVPVTTSNSHLVATLSDGSLIRGEGRIDRRRHGLPIVSVALKPKSKANRQALKAIALADLVVIGPGDLFTSILPNLLVRGIPEALQATKAQVVYVVNIMTKPGETDGFDALDFVEEIERYLGKNVIDVVIVNAGKPAPKLIQKYRKQDQEMVVVKKGDFARAPFRVLTADLISQQNLIRHDPHKLAKILLNLIKID